MANGRQIVLLHPGENGEAVRPLGRKGEILDKLAVYNIGTDGSDEGFATAWGPGFRVEFPFVDEKEQIRQVMVSVVEEDFAWPVLARICKDLQWKMMDPESGRTFGG